MATILLTDDEYNFINGLRNDLLTKMQTASPRAATHYGNIAKEHADFIAKEDGKRATSKAKTSTRDAIAQAKQARKNGTGAPTQAQATRPNSGQTSKSA